MRTSFLSLAMCLCIAGCLSSCDTNTEDYTVLPLAYVIQNRPSEMAHGYAFIPEDAPTELHLSLSVTNLPEDWYSQGISLEGSTIKGDEYIEQQIWDYIGIDKNKNIGVPVKMIEYRTEVCKSIHISLYDNGMNEAIDITDLAVFSDKSGFFLFDSDKELLGRIKDGTTVKEYLSTSPLIFPYAEFSFPSLKHSCGNETLIEIEIELESGKVLKAESNVNV